MSSNQLGSADRKEQARQREIEGMRDFARQVTARLSRLIQAGYNSSHGTEENPIVLDDSDDDKAVSTHSARADNLEPDELPSTTSALDGEGPPPSDGFWPLSPYEQYQNDPQFPCLRSNLRRMPLPDSVPSVPVRAPAGPTEMHFVYADEQDEYLAQCPANTDFSQVVFMPTNANGSAPGSSNNNMKNKEDDEDKKKGKKDNGDADNAADTKMSDRDEIDGVYDIDGNHIAIAQDLFPPPIESPSSTGADDGSFASTPPPTPPSTGRSPHHHLGPSEAEHFQNLFIAKGLALRARDEASASTSTPASASASSFPAALQRPHLRPHHLPLPPPPTGTGTGTASPRHLPRSLQQQLLPPHLLLPHLDDEDDSVRSHYAQCEVCRGIRRRAVPDGHEYWKGLMEGVRVGGTERVAREREGAVTRSVRRAWEEDMKEEEEDKKKDRKGEKLEE
ncbi:cytochrome p450 [Diplodia corticola]|uniref:Cytochrome p450 n=1 Tax=Diplodia corticola TaxID=236234 RepID=A0A1J9QS21_9PEZI|nr:cytochrome p450 [Diplodia corticola]OJD31248.1 cytochrome p450 [Diplodia corticola]